MTDQRLLLPGPVLMPDEAYQALRRPIVNHRGPEAQRLFEELTEGLRWLFQTEGRVLALTASGTGGLESAVVNCFSRGDRVLVASAGAFGERWAKIARAFGLEVSMYEQPWGEAIDPEKLAGFAARHRDAKGILLTHSETSTGTVHDVKAMVAALTGHSALRLVDVVSSAGAVPFWMDEWGIDVAVSASQKALASTPGLAFVAVGERAWARRGDLPRFYFDWEPAAEFAERGQTPWTPALHVLYATVASLRLLRDEGMETAWQRHQRLGAAVRAGVRALGLSLFSKAADQSNTVTAIALPEDVEGGELVRQIRERTGVVFAGGQGRLAGKILRFGHLGRVEPADVLAGLEALEEVLPSFGVKLTAGAAVAAAKEILW